MTAGNGTGTLLRVPTKPVDWDVLNARFLADSLNGVADGLEAEPRRFAAWRPKIRSLIKVWSDLDDARPNVADSKHRAFFLGLLKLQGKSVKGGAAPSAAASACIRVMQQELPEYAARLAKHRTLIETALDTYRTNVGGRGQRVLNGGRPVLIEKICMAVGWSGGTDATRQARARRKNDPKNESRANRHSRS